MTDREFERALSPDQMREALSLLDGTVDAQLRKLGVEDLGSAEEVDCGTDQASAGRAAENQLPAAGDPQHKKHLKEVIVFYGLGIAAAAALTLLAWSERVPKPAGSPGIAREQIADAQPAPLANGVSPLAITNPVSEQVAIKDPINRASAIPRSAETPKVTAVATMPPWWDEPGSGKRREVWRHSPAVRVAAAKKRFWRRHWQHVAEFNSGECYYAACPSWPRQRIFYEPPRTVTQ